jgi:hypothetical protein
MNSEEQIKKQNVIASNSEAIYKNSKHWIASALRTSQ